LTTPSTPPHPQTGSRAGLLGGHLAEALWLSALVIVPLTMNVAAARTFEAAKLAAVAPLAALALFAMLAACSDASTRLAPALKTEPSVWAFALMIATGVAATLNSQTPWIAFFGDYFRREGMAAWLVYTIFFAAIVLLLRQRDQLDRLLDTILLVSVLSCVYGLQQRFGFDFFNTGGNISGASIARPGANLGNPTFLSAYLLLVIPLTIARIACSVNWLNRIPWITLLFLQLVTAALTQSRGPLLGLIATLFLLAVLLGGSMRWKSLVGAALGGAAITIAALVAINLAPDLQALVKDTPLQRFVLARGIELTSTDSRIGIWQMGVDAFVNTPLVRMLIGAGPDASHFYYFPHLPSWLLRVEGLTETIDRLHNETMETLMTFGVIGFILQVCFYSGLVRVACNALTGRALSAGMWAFPLASLAVGLAAGAALQSAGSAKGLFPVGFGLGIALTWSLALLWTAWAMLRKQTVALPRADAALVIGLIGALVGSWIEVQVGVPTITTRLMTTMYGALLLLLCYRLIADAGEARQPEPAVPPAATSLPDAGPKAARKRKQAQRVAAAGTAARAALQYRPTTVGWVVGLALVVATAAYFPPLQGPSIMPPSPQRLNLIIVPLLALLACGLLFAAAEARRLETSFIDASARFLIAFSIPWVLFMLAYAQFGGAIRGASDALVGARINGLLLCAFGGYVVIALAFGLHLYLADPLRHRLARARLLSSALLLAGLIAGGSAFHLAMRDVRADTYAKLTTWAHSRQRGDAADAFARTAADLMPAERRFSGTLAGRMVDRTAREIPQAASNAEIGKRLIRQLEEAQAMVARGRALAPHDPWVMFASANVHQFLSLAVLESAGGKEARQRNAEIARAEFAEARKQFPGHPWILRNWAQLDIDFDDRPAAYAKFDQMESLDPRNAAIYLDRLRFTRAFGDHAIAIASLRKGIAAQPAGSAAIKTLRYELARYFKGMGDAVQAGNVWREIVAADPADFTAAAEVVEAYAVSGQRDLAIGNAQATLARIDSATKDTQAAAARIRIEGLLARLNGIPPAKPGAVPAGPQTVVSGPAPASRPTSTPASAPAPAGKP